MKILTTKEIKALLGTFRLIKSFKLNDLENRKFTE